MRIHLQMEPATQVSEIGHVIQLAVAPVFLLAGISGLLNVLTGRLGRIIDRARLTEQQMSEASSEDAGEKQLRLQLFSRRARLVNYAITLSTASASMICLVVMALFGGAFVALDVSRVIALLFVASMGSLFAALVCFLREVLLATQSLRIGATTQPFRQHNN